MTESRRRPGLAALLSLLLPGLGHLYAGSPRRAAGYYAGELATTHLLVILLVYWPMAPWNALVGMALFLVWRLISMVAAFRYSRRQPPCRGWSAWVRWPAYATIYVVATYGPALATRAIAFEAFRVPAGSMSDTLMPGDRVIAVKWGLDAPRRGEVIVFRMPTGEVYVKRVIGMPGERVEVRDGIAIVDGQPLEEPYVRPDNQVDVGAFGPVVVPTASYFVLGDNRDRSRDSRVADFGFVREPQIFGDVRAIFWSDDFAQGGVRWDRIGRPVR